MISPIFLCMNGRERWSDSHAPDGAIWGANLDREMHLHGPCRDSGNDLICWVPV